MADPLLSVSNLPLSTQDGGEDGWRVRGKATDAVWQDAGGLTYEDPDGPNGWRAKGDQRVRERALEMLQALGLAPYEERPPKTTVSRLTRSPRGYGRCRVCRKRQTMRSDGMVGAHKFGGYKCDGGGREPVDG